MSRYPFISVGIIAGAASAYCFALLHRALISDIWFSLPALPRSPKMRWLTMSGCKHCPVFDSNFIYNIDYGEYITHPASSVSSP